MPYGVFRSSISDFFGSLLILTTVDLAVGREFSEAIGRLHALDGFGGIFIDEVHDVFVLRDFCMCMQLLWGICTLPFSIVVMSGVRVTGHKAPGESSVNITVSSYDTTYLQENPQRLG